MNEFLHYDPTLDKKVDEAPADEEKEGAVEAFGRKLIKEAKVCKAFVDYLEANPGVEIARYYRNPEIKKIVGDHGIKVESSATMAQFQGIINEVNEAREKISEAKSLAVEESEKTGEKWENILVRNILGVGKLENDIQILHSDFYLMFLTSDVRDFMKLQVVGDIPSEGGGYTNMSSETPHIVIFAEGSDDATKERISHEEQHVYNRFVLENSEHKLEYKTKNLQDEIKKNGVPTPAKLEGLITEIFSDLYVGNSKNEILAYLRNNSSKENLASDIVEVQIMNYSEKEEEEDVAYFEGLLYLNKWLPEDPNSDNPYDEQVMGFTENAYRKSTEIVRGWIGDAERVLAALSKTEKRQDVIFMLGLTPIKTWGRLANVFENIKQKKEMRLESDSNVYEEVVGRP
jgi:hypothetical protein